MDDPICALESTDVKFVLKDDTGEIPLTELIAREIVELRESQKEFRGIKYHLARRSII